MLPNASQIVIPWAVVQVHDTPLLSVLQFHGQSSGHVQPTAGVDPSGHGTLVVPLRLAHAVVASTTERAVIHRSRIVRAVIASSSFLLVSGCCSRIGQVVLVDPVCPPPPMDCQELFLLFLILGPGFGGVFLDTTFLYAR